MLSCLVFPVIFFLNTNAEKSEPGSDEIFISYLLYFNVQVEYKIQKERHVLFRSISIIKT